MERVEPPAVQILACIALILSSDPAYAPNLHSTAEPQSSSTARLDPYCLRGVDRTTHRWPWQQAHAHSD